MKSENTSVLILIILSLTITSQAQSTFITTFKTPSIMCDYLIICPNQFLACASRLASFRNSFTGDEVTYAKFVSLDTIEREFPVGDTLPRCFSIWYAMQYARLHWYPSPKYLVLIGDDSVAVSGFDAASMPKSAGLMPTFITSADTVTNNSTKKLDTTVCYTDYLYGIISDTTPPVNGHGRRWAIPIMVEPAPFFIGRIPAENITDCNNYITKLIAFESLQDRHGWQNKVVLCADDRMQGLRVDPLSSWHLESCEAIDNILGDGFFSRKIFLSSFVTSPTGRHDVAKKAFFSAVGPGARWCVYFGHGQPDSLSDEAFLRNTDTGLFTNDSAPAMFFSFSCSNGDFIRRPSPPMCKSFLFKQSGGCLAYFGASKESYASDNEKLARNLFSHAKDTQQVSLGEAITIARALCRDENMQCYQLLGDPALRFRKNDPQLSPAIALGANGAISVSGLVPPATGGQAYFRYEISYPETVWCIDSIQYPGLGPLSYIKDSVIASAEGPMTASLGTQIPAGFNADKINFAFYIANDEFEERFDTTFTFEVGVRAPAFAKVPLGPALRFSRSVVTLSLDRAQSDAIPLLSVFDLKGRLIKRVAMSVSKGAATLDLNTMGICGGNYLVKITAKNQTFVTKACFLR